MPVHPWDKISKNGPTWVHRDLYRKGVVALYVGSERSLTEPLTATLASAKSDKNVWLKFGNRRLNFLDHEDIDALTAQSILKPKKTNNAAKAILRANQLLDKLATKHDPSASAIATKRAGFMHQDSRMAEIFLPLITHEGSLDQKATGVYVNPWLSSQDSGRAEAEQAAFMAQPFTGFQQFVTASCMFGTSLVATFNLQSTIPIIKHDIEFYSDDQQIISIHFDNESAYEAIILAELHHAIDLIQQQSQADADKHLTFHLPYFDYILFGVKLYLTNRMTKDALAQLIVDVLDKKEVYERHINELCSKNGIQVDICSPFDALFADPGLGDLKQELRGRTRRLSSSCLSPVYNENTPIDDAYGESSQDGNDFFEKVWDLLSLQDYDVPKGMDASQRLRNETQFVRFCLEKLCGYARPTLKAGSNGFNIPSSVKLEEQVWQDFWGTQTAPELSMEQLFKVGNAVVIGWAAKDRACAEVCTVYPLSEKQIPLAYAKFVESLTALYPTTFNITSMDNVVAYNNTPSKKPGVLFYLNFLRTLGLQTFLQKDSSRNLYKARENIVNPVVKTPTQDASAINSASATNATSATRTITPTFLVNDQSDEKASVKMSAPVEGIESGLSGTGVSYTQVMLAVKNHTGHSMQTSNSLSIHRAASCPNLRNTNSST